MRENSQQSGRMYTALALCLVGLVAFVVGRLSVDDDQAVDPAEPTELPGVTTTTSASAVNPTTPDEVASTPEVDPRSRFVDSEAGNDNGSGTLDDPWKTLDRAFETLEPGRTIVLRAGEYEPGPDIEVSGTADAPIVISSFDGERAVIVADGTNGVRIDGASHVTVRGLEVTAPESSERGAGIRADNGASNIVIVDNIVHGMPGNGIGSSRADRLTIEGNVVFGNAEDRPNQPSGISLFLLTGDGAGDDFANVIRGNLVYDNRNLTPTEEGELTDGNCIIIDRSQAQDGDDESRPDYEGRTLIENNICSRNGGRGVHILRSDNVVVRHNTFYRNLETEEIRQRSGELSAFKARDVEFVGNVVVPRGGASAASIEDSSGVFQSGNWFDTENPVDLGAEDVKAAYPFVADEPRSDRAEDFEPVLASSVAPGPSGAPAADYFGTPRAERPAVGAVEPR